MTDLNKTVKSHVANTEMTDLNKTWQIQKMTDLNKTVKSHVANTEDD